MKFSPDRLKQARKISGYTQATLAAAIHGHARTVQEWEYGKVSPRGEVLKRISEVLGKPVEYFFEPDEGLVNKGGAIEQHPSKANPYAPPPALTHKAMPSPSVAKKLRTADQGLILAIKEFSLLQGLVASDQLSGSDLVALRKGLARLQGVIAEAQDQLDKAMRGEE